MSNSKDFTGKVVLITGSSGGIGAVTAIQFAKYGAQVVISGRNGQKLSSVSQQCAQVSPNRLEALEVLGDVSHESDCRRLVDITVQTFGKLDILVNNAGIGATSGIRDPNILDTYDRLMATNLRSVVCLTHLCVAHLEKTKGNIVNISSMAALTPRPSMSIYSMSKSALDMFSKCLALELGPKGIRVNVVNPSGVRTDFSQAMGVDKDSVNSLLEVTGSSYPLGRIGEPIDIANAVLFLASDECSFVTAINFVADGGALWGAPPPKLR